MKEQRKKIDEQLATEMKAMSYNELSRRGEDIAVEEGYHPAGYGFFNPRVEKLNEQWYFVWECFDSCH